MSLALWLVGAAIVVGVAVLALGLVDPLTARLGLRNVMRHRRQTLTVIVGLLAGTAIIGASLVTGDSLGAGMRGTAIDATGETDVIVRVPGNLFVPEVVFDALVEPPLPDRVDGTSAIVLETAALEQPETDLFEPSAVVIGFDFEIDRPFGAFVDSATREPVFGEDLGPGDVYLNARVADKLEATAGDRVTMTYRESFVPFVPHLTWLNGTLVAASAAPAGDGGYTYVHSTADLYETRLSVPRGSIGILAAVAWPDPTGSVDLDLELLRPDGESFRATNGTFAPESPVPLPLQPPPPAPQQVTGRDNPTTLFVPREDMVEGEWTFRVHGKNARDQPYVAFAAVLVPEYDLERAVRFFEQVSDQFGDDLAGPLDPRRAAGEGLERTVVVKRVVAMEGKGLFFGSDAVFMTKEAAQTMYGLEGRANWLKVTNRGGPEEGLEGTDAVVEALESRLEGLRATPGALPAGALENIQVVPLKQDFVERTEEAAVLFTQFLTLIGSFTILAGVMLIINIFSMLAEERRHELGIARALGLTRRSLIRAFTFEGSLYTLAASALGVLVGMGLAAFLVWGINSLTPPDSLFSIPYRAEPLSLAVAFAAGALLTFATVVFASFRASRLNIVRAIRDLDDAEVGGGRRLRGRILVFGAVLGLTIFGLLVGSYLALALGPALVAFAAGPLLAPRLGRRRTWIGIALAVVAYVLIGFAAFPGPDGLERDLATVARGLVLVIAATMVFVEWEAVPRGFAWLLRRNRRLAPIASVATTYPLHRRLRTGLTLSMYALVLFIIVVFSVFFTMFTPDITQESGGYHVMGFSQVPESALEEVRGVTALAGTDEDPFQGVERYDFLADHFEFGRGRILLDGEEPTGFSQGSARFVGFDEAFATANGFGLDVWDPVVGSTEAEVYRRVAEDPSLVLVSYGIVADLAAKDGRTHGPGTVLTINTTSGQRDYTIVGIMEQTFFGGVWMQRAEVERLFPQHDGLYLFRLEPGVDASEAAKRIERAFRPIGMDAEDVEAEAAELQEESARIFQLFQAYLGLGLIVGVASIGIVTSRAVLERRREIGMLKAIGFTRGMIAQAFLAEVLFILLVASVIGLGMGLAVARAIYVGQLSGIPGVSWIIPWGRILQMLGLALVATLVATLLPALRAARVPAAEALRTME